MAKLCFVILHYKTADDTIECIESVEKIEDEKNIVVVDNASNNGSIECVEEFSRKYDNIFVIKNDKNLGFAEGNNIGYRFAKNKLKAEIIAVLNNDIIVPDVKTIKKIEELYKKTEFDVAGPDIVSLVDNGHQNPMKEVVLDVKDVQKEILRYRVLLFLNNIGIYDILKKNKNQVTQKENKDIKENKNIVDRKSVV